ncbi:hypothetical protein GGU11DRAFT_748134 [Lentinula aff. detonsa]|nr:hypothetical protein GGU11DRAFT_748134 [Lentinula aff. detonsa]
MLTLVIIGIFIALEEWEEGEDQREEQDFASATFADIVRLYNTLLIDKIHDAKLVYIAMQKRAKAFLSLSTKTLTWIWREWSEAFSIVLFKLSIVVGGSISMLLL